MIPDPITAASRSAVPINSATSGRLRTMFKPGSTRRVS